MAGIQETCGLDSMLLHSGDTLSGDGEPLIRIEGVHIVLDQDATTAWKKAGECWKVCACAHVCPYNLLT